MSDLISREDLIKSIDFDVPLNQYERDTLNLVLKRIKALPTVDREESVLKALEDVKAEINKEIEDKKEVSHLTIATKSYMSALLACRYLIDRKIKEIKDERS